MLGEDYFEKYYKESCQMKLDTLVRVLDENMLFNILKDFSKKGKNFDDCR